MKFNATNEDGEQLSALVLRGTKKVSRRKDPYPVGMLVPFVDENMKVRGQLCIKACTVDDVWHSVDDWPAEARLEGFKTWATCKGTLLRIYGRMPLYRVEFKLVR